MRGVPKFAAVPLLPIVVFAVSAGPASADPVSFDPAHVDVGTGCAGTVRAEVSASQGQQAGEFVDFIDSSSRVQVNFTPDTNANPLDSLSASPGAANDCQVTTTVTMRNIDTGVSTTDTRTTAHDGHYGWNAAFFTLAGAGRVTVQVSTNPTPAEVTIDVPAP
ncbi:hypothetical protein GFY24_33165 [Nocardia sp. SYP-A9097]|uniref:hypothetical protein n=1 Tax=Nocardia sp. SYP-A9097 TaxID=2663237 RepID=UPI00129B3C87|nr:hypothetical protein [Nocardia sp. SYP-A9097]MRH92230.1 hypothetical protein [Nocardia sp. SYP-A9097]